MGVFNKKPRWWGKEGRVACSCSFTCCGRQIPLLQKTFVCSFHAQIIRQSFLFSSWLLEVSHLMAAELLDCSLKCYRMLRSKRIQDRPAGTLWASSMFKQGMWMWVLLHWLVACSATVCRLVLRRFCCPVLPCLPCHTHIWLFALHLSSPFYLAVCVGPVSAYDACFHSL